jgi:hypothetical protein
VKLSIIKRTVTPTEQGSVIREAYEYIPNEEIEDLVRRLLYHKGGNGYELNFRAHSNTIEIRLEKEQQ